MIDRAGLAAFLRARREALQPEDVGLPRGRRRRTSGLRREEVATLAHMSTDYYARLEQQRGPHPTTQMIASIAQGLHLSIDERDHLFRLAGQQPPARGVDSDHVSPGLLRIFDRLDDTPAEIVNELGETLRQTRLGAALCGDATALTGPERSIGYRWFTDPHTRERYAPQQHEALSRLFAGGLRQVAALRGPGSRAAGYAELLRERSAEFRALWDEQQIDARIDTSKTFLHPEVGEVTVFCQTLLDPETSHRLLVYTAVPGSESHSRLELLAVIGTASLT